METTNETKKNELTSEVMDTITVKIEITDAGKCVKTQICLPDGTIDTERVIKGFTAKLVSNSVLDAINKGRETYEIEKIMCQGLNVDELENLVKKGKEEKSNNVETPDTMSESNN